MDKTLLDFLIKGIVSVILNGPSCKDSNARFTTVAFKPSSHQRGRYCRFSRFKRVKFLLFLTVENILQKKLLKYLIRQSF